jgi:hypothetical protein
MSNISYDAIKSILSNPSAMDCVRNSPELTPYYSASKGNLIQLKFLYDMKVSGWDTDVVNIAAQNKHYDIVIWYSVNGLIHHINLETISILCTHNAIGCINYLMDKGISCDPHSLLQLIKTTFDTNNIGIINVIKNGWLCILKLMLIDKTIQHDFTKMVYTAIANNNLDIVIWLFEKKSPIFEPNMNVLCIEMNYINMFKYFTKTMKFIDNYLLFKAIFHERHEIVTYICELYHDMICNDPCFMNYAYINGKYEIMKLLSQNGAFCDHIAITGVIKTHNTDLINIVTKNTPPNIMSLALHYATSENCFHVVRFISNNFKYLDYFPSIKCAHVLGLHDIHKFLMQRQFV